MWYSIKFCFWLIIFIISVVLFGMWCDVGCEYKTLKIVEIGGCNRYRCAVRYEDGTTGQEPLPLIGEKVTVRICK